MQGAEGSDSLLDTINRVDNLRELPAYVQGNNINQNINIPFVDETVHNPIMSDDFPRSIPLSTKQSSNIKIKTKKDMPNQPFIDKILGLLNHKSRHFYQLPFELEVLHKEQRRDKCFVPIIDAVHLQEKLKKLTFVSLQSEFCWE